MDLGITTTELEGVPSAQIVQGYLILKDRRQTQARLRRQDDTHTLTIKHPGGPEPGHPESEIHLSPEQFEALWPMTKGKRLHKTRYLFPANTVLDVYHEALDGHVVAEVEFQSIEAANAYVPADWLGDEIRVTDLHFEEGRPHVLYEHLWTAAESRAYPNERSKWLNLKHPKAIS